MPPPPAPAPPPSIRIGWKEYLDLPDLGLWRLKGKIDTGARTSTLHVQDLVYLERPAAGGRALEVDQVLDMQGGRTGASVDFALQPPQAEIREVEVLLPADTNRRRRRWCGRRGHAAPLFNGCGRLRGKRAGRRPQRCAQRWSASGEQAHKLQLAPCMRSTNARGGGPSIRLFPTWFRDRT